MKKATVFKITMMSLISKNYHQWIKKLRGIANNADVWKYVDSKNNVIASKKLKVFDFIDYQIPANIEPEDVRSIKSATSYDDLFDRQKDNYKMNVINFKMKKTYNEEIAKNMRLILTVLKMSIRQHISVIEMDSSVKKIIQLLTARYKQSNKKIIQQMHEEYCLLKVLSVKRKIKQWINDWENMRIYMKKMKIAGNFGTKKIFIIDFLLTGRKWAPNFCENWEREHEISAQFLIFHKTTRHYRKAVKKFLYQSIEVIQENSINLQDQDQKKTTLIKKIVNWKDKCVCELIHHFNKCSYICIDVRIFDWKSIQVMWIKIRQKIEFSVIIFKFILKWCDIDLLKNITLKTMQKAQNEVHLKKILLKTILNIYLSMFSLK